MSHKSIFFSIEADLMIMIGQMKSCYDRFIQFLLLRS